MSRLDCTTSWWDRPARWMARAKMRLSDLRLRLTGPPPEDHYWDGWNDGLRAAMEHIATSERQTYTSLEVLDLLELHREDADK